MQTHEISKISSAYEYYNAQSTNYWSKKLYRLQTAMSHDGQALIYIPEDERFLTPQDAHHYCACARVPSLSTKIFNDLKREISHFEIQKTKIGLSIEPERLQNNSLGSLLPILKPYLNQNPVKRDSSFYIDSVTPLIPHNLTHESLLHNFLFLGAKKIGASVALGLLDRSLSQIKEKYGATSLENIWGSNDDSTTDFFDLSQLSLDHTNFTLIVKFKNYELYGQNVSQNIILADKLLKNLTLNNKQFFNFMERSAQSLLLQMASDSLINNIDYSRPVLAVIDRGTSFYSCTFFITTVSPENSVTNYLANSLPSTIKDTKLYGVSVPQSFSSVSLGHSYRFHDAQSQALDSCVNSFMGTGNFPDIPTECPEAEYPAQKLRILQSLDQANLILARGRKETLKIMCPSSEPLFFTLTHDILIAYVHTHCETNLISKNGVLTINRNDTGIGFKTFVPHLLFTYDLDSDMPTDQIQWILISTISSVLGIFVILLTVVSYLLYKNRIQAQIVSRSASPDSKSDIDLPLTSPPELIFKESAL